MGLTGCPETYATNYQSTLRKIAEERIYHCTEAFLKLLKFLEVIGFDTAKEEIIACEITLL
jgi:hypothetical protein